ncbi:hypothetical protein NOK12_08330 [Nocardioides sp. OK12]|uniref:Na+/melibiose symporter-like transporter n=1 Tax=Nocardioides marinisabuli TaxID=419476 RepID=A0A7Y9JRP7_9ACTN|nr:MULTISPECIES: hypothetical protein [Nocardioides]NYD58720.1 Na+/melibiose symporter-like transporter [Nocardioides marinisabuli]GHJ58314.1 hypothetical protein NOK12_08330 [Nocardioides sp. OK12]
MTRNDTVRTRRSGARWLVPVVAALIGLAYLVAGLVAGDEVFGIGGLVLMLGLGGVLLLLSGRSETIAGLLDRRDERINKLDADASLFSGMTLVAAVLVMFVVEIARGQDGAPYYQLGALAGVSYVVALVHQRLRG